MIQEAQAKQLLEEAFARMNPGEAMEPGRRKYAELRVRRAERRVSCTGNLYQKAREALTEQETVWRRSRTAVCCCPPAAGWGGRTRPWWNWSLTPIP